jgi:ClpP class serine protease
MRHHPATRLLGRPILLAPDAVEALQAEMGREEQRPGFLGRLIGARAAPPPKVQAEARLPEALAGRKIEQRSGYIVADGVAVVRIDGVIYAEGGCYEDWYGTYRWYGYDGLRQILAAAAVDDAVKGIFLRVNSPGGEVIGMSETAAAIAAITKPVAAHITGIGHSAAYALAVGAHDGQLTCGEACTVGSIGAVMIHTDTSKADERWGFSVTPIQFGSGKTDGYPFQPLSDEALAHFQAQIDAIGQRFVDWVATRRGLSPEAVLATNARIEMDQSALALGLVDAVATETEAFAAFAASLSSDPAGAPAAPTAPKPASAQTAATTEETMGLKQQIDAALGRLAKGPDKAKAASAEEVLGEIRELVSKADDEEEGEGNEAAAEGDDTEKEAATDDEAEGEEDKPAAKASAAKPGTAAYVLAVTGLPEAQGREQAARTLAATGKLSVAEVKTVLAAMPKKSAFAPQNPSVGTSAAGSGRDAKAVAASWDTALKSARVARKG